jgi:hypothetical protein|tara:strand:- start:649 stop:897 length:249 start_codon:yes stop_codon:yes gene_type:complete
MNNWQTEYRVKYHITFVHDDGRTEVVTDDMIIESRSPEEVEKIILNKYENGDDPLTNFPDGWLGKIHSEELEIDEIVKVWEY